MSIEYYTVVYRVEGDKAQHDAWWQALHPLFLADGPPPISIVKEDQAVKTMLERAELGVDGDHAFALLGENIQEGEAVFVKVESTAPRWTAECQSAERRAATKALNDLRLKLGRQISYWIGPSHPDHA